jgi:hypothetical protein
VFSAVADATVGSVESSLSISLLAVVPVGMWAKASISPLFELAREAVEAQPVSEADRPRARRQSKLNESDSHPTRRWREIDSNYRFRVRMATLLSPRTLPIAARLGKPQSFVSEYERGQRRVDVVELLVISRALAIDPLDLFGEIARSTGPFRATAPIDMILSPANGCRIVWSPP